MRDYHYGSNKVTTNAQWSFLRKNAKEEFTVVPPTETRNHMNLPYSIRIPILNEFLTADRSCITKYF